MFGTVISLTLSSKEGIHGFGIQLTSGVVGKLYLRYYQKICNGDPFSKVSFYLFSRNTIFTMFLKTSGSYIELCSVSELFAKACQNAFTKKSINTLAICRYFIYWALIPLFLNTIIDVIGQQNRYHNLIFGYSDFFVNNFFSRIFLLYLLFFSQQMHK